ncbi:hypothetical protein GCM10010230_44790 [Streptomyces narbonensis]|nr:hypothetical protein GCM10010230_44790 [Streptomyces narbonensis]
MGDGQEAGPDQCRERERRQPCRRGVVVEGQLDREDGHHRPRQGRTPPREPRPLRLEPGVTEFRIRGPRITACWITTFRITTL